MLDVRGQEDTGKVVLVSLEGADRNNAGHFGFLKHSPNVHVSLDSQSSS